MEPGNLHRASRRGEPWTAEEYKLLASSLAAGLSIAEVAGLIGRSQSAVHTKALNFDLVPKRPRQQRLPRNNGRRSADFFLS